MDQGNAHFYERPIYIHARYVLKEVLASLPDIE